MAIDLDRYQIRLGNGEGTPSRLPKGRVRLVYWNEAAQ